MTDPTPLDDVEFLARSAHRVQVLRTLATGARTRPDLHEETGVSQPTLGRVLDSFEDRNWVERGGREYALTAFGELVVEAFEDLLDTVDTVQRLGDVVGRLPTDEMDFDVREFADATVTTPETGDAFTHVRRITEVFWGGDDVQLLGATVAPGSREEHDRRWREFLEGEKRYDSVISVATMEQSMEDPQMLSRFRRALESGRVTVHLYDGPISLMLVVADDTALLAPLDDDGIPTAAIETENEIVRAWVEDRIDEHRDRATEVTADDFPA